MPRLGRQDYHRRPYRCGKLGAGALSLGQGLLPALQYDPPDHGRSRRGRADGSDSIPAGSWACAWECREFSASAVVIAAGRQADSGTGEFPRALIGMRSLVTLTFVCPATNHELDYRLEADARTLIRRWSKSLKCRCPYCNSVHSFAFRAGYVNGMISHVSQTEREPSSSLIGR